EAMPISIGKFRLEGVGFGLGFSVRVAADKKNPGFRLGEYGWGGAANTTFWISPKDDLVVVALQQFMPGDRTLELRLRSSSRPRSKIQKDGRLSKNLLSPCRR